MTLKASLVKRIPLGAKYAKKDPSTEPGVSKWIEKGKKIVDTEPEIYPKLINYQRPLHHGTVADLKKDLLGFDIFRQLI